MYFPLILELYGVQYIQYYIVFGTALAVSMGLAEIPLLGYYISFLRQKATSICKYSKNVFLNDAWTCYIFAFRADIYGILLASS